MAEPVLSLSLEQYTALVTLARNGTKTADGQIDETKAHVLDNFLKTIERANGIQRDSVWVQWQEADYPLPPTTRFPDVWPPEMRYLIELVSRKVAKTDVDAVLKAHAKKPVNVLVTRDIGARVGWTEVSKFFLT